MLAGEGGIDGDTQSGFVAGVQVSVLERVGVRENTVTDLTK